MGKCINGQVFANGQVLAHGSEPGPGPRALGPRVEGVGEWGAARPQGPGPRPEDMSKNVPISKNLPMNELAH